MKLPRTALALALSSSLLLAACSGSDEPEESTDTSSTAADASPDAADTTGDAGESTGDAGESTGDAGESTGDAAGSTGDAAESTGDASESTGDAAGSTGDAGDSTAAPGEDSETDDAVITAPAAGAGVLSVEEGEEIASQLMREAADSQNADAEEAAELNESAFSGSELRAAVAATSLRDIGITPVIDYHPTSPNVLAISREDGEFPAYMVVQSVPESGLPELHLMVQEEDGGDWKIGWSAPMLAGTEIGTFDPRSEGSTVIRDGKAGLTNYPSYVVDMLFQILDYPFADERPDFRTNNYGPQVRAAAEEQAASVAEQATLTQDHSLRSGTLRTIELADGSAIMFPVLERKSTFDVLDGMILEPSSAFAHFAEDDTITDSAEMTTLVFLAVHVRADGGDPEVIAAREQVVGANGS
ncbi:hypothetical protein NF556_17185 [Ornithinimicrobium faecis]|uniref:Lipoprotein n=1 Tax=Ornithinimicrobium faecis TaxID=2934158 RepID=A0ABY4YSI8_9MICO|nr:hypothetical protein [Ornithinimicrobium sp. HY1793]USQ79323.1 hypothetical protein NF556_17185 [Ornithinimicrobium sp. HY1793]